MFFAGVTTVARGPPPQTGQGALSCERSSVVFRSSNLAASGAARFHFSEVDKRHGSLLSRNNCPNRTMCQEHFGYMGIVSPAWRFKMKQVLGVSVAILLFGSGVWANLSVGSLSQNTGAWVSHSR
jgi:hypothetical protein